MDGMKKILEGVKRFQDDVYPSHQELFEKLATGQSPEAMLIACADSRVEPGMILQAKPGDVFVCRNAGNIVPPHVSHTGGTTASIEFAVAALNVRHIIIMGHTDCGAMKGALNPEGLKDLPHVSEWLGHSKAAAQIVEAKLRAGQIGKEERLVTMTHENVILQLQHIKTHPYVAERVAMGELFLHGWVYDIEHGVVEAFEESTRKFKTVDERYQDSVVAMMGKAHKHEAA